MSYIVEKNIPLPSSPRSRTVTEERNTLFASMNIGDSILVDKEAVCAAAHSYARKNPDLNIEFTQRQVGKGYRLWRIK